MQRSAENEHTHALDEQRLRLIIDAAPNGMLMVNRSGQIVLVNSQIERLFQYSREELLGKSIKILVPETDRAKHPGYRESFSREPKARYHITLSNLPQAVEGLFFQSVQPMEQ